MIVARPLALGLVVLAAAACRPAEEAQAPVPPRPVRTVTMGTVPPPAPAVFPGRIEAKDIADLGFRVGGRMAERRVSVGDAVRPGDVLARLDSEVEQNELRLARSALVAAESAQRQAAARLERTTQLYNRAIASRAEFEAAEQAAKAARAQVEASAAQVRIAEDVVGFTVLKADSAGVVTTIAAEPGEVVAAGRPVVQVARRDGRDAVFDVPAPALEALSPDAKVSVTMPGDPAARAAGRVREVSPEADPVTRQFRVRVGLVDAPAALRLGSSVQVALLPAEAEGFPVPAAALLREGTAAAVWIVDPASGVVSRRAVEIASEDPGMAVVSRGLAAGDIVVAAGVSTLRAGQKVRLGGTER